MPNFSIEFHLRRLVRVLGRKLDIDLVATAFVWGIIWSLNVAFPVPNITVEQRDLDSRFFGLSRGGNTVLANYSNSFLIRN